MITEIHFAGFSTQDIGLLLVALMTLSVGLNAMFINFATDSYEITVNINDKGTQSYEQTTTTFLIVQNYPEPFAYTNRV